MTDNRTTELLRKLLEERGIDYKLRRASGTSARETVYWEYEKDGDWASAEYAVTVPLEGHGDLSASCLTPEQAIAATLGSGTLTAEHVMAIAAKHQPDYCSDTHVCFDWQAIADELNAALGGGECKVVASSTDGLTTDNPKQWFELSCGHTFKLDGLDVPVACPVCGKAVKR